MKRTNTWGTKTNELLSKRKNVTVMIQPLDYCLSVILKHVSPHWKEVFVPPLTKHIIFTISTDFSQIAQRFLETRPGEYFQLMVYIGAFILFNLDLSGLQISFPIEYFV
jgi:hypothetical protein